LTDDARNVPQDDIADLENTDVIAVLKFGYSALERSSVISESQSGKPYKDLTEAREHKIRDTKAMYQPWLGLLQDRALSLQKGDQSRRSL
jgi:hypothetical protein